MKGRLSYAILVAMLVSGSQPAIAEGSFCARLDGLIDLAIMTETPATFALNGRYVDCVSSRGLGGTVALHCGWPFGYRAPQATEAFENLLDQVAICAVQRDVETSLVSHPDSYDLRQFTLGNGIVSVSLKDKSGLAETYVFLRVEQPNPG